MGQHLGHRCLPARPSLCSTGCEGSRSLRPRCKHTHTHTVKHEQTAPLLFIGRWVHLIRNLCFLCERKAVAGTYGKKGMKNCFSSSHSIFPLMMSLMSITGNTRKQNGLFHMCVERVCYVPSLATSEAIFPHRAPPTPTSPQQPRFCRA